MADDDKGNTKDTYAWRLSDGTYYYVRVNALQITEAVLGVAAPVEGEQFVACINNKFDSYSVFDDLESAQNYVAAIVALEAGA